ncbi:MAG: T9SS type A sorting domain-containing protein [Bacteroidales bacterium]|nr:T9SS type A sorting domain-containing protein [Bacteroidales bacterium]
MTTFLKCKARTTLVLIAVLFATTSYTQQTGWFGPAGVYLSVNERTTLYRINTTIWDPSAGSLNSAVSSSLDGVDLAIPTSLTIVSFRSVGSGDLNNKQKIFYRIRNVNTGETTAWTPFLMEWVSGIPGQSNQYLQEVGRPSSIDILAEADTWNGEGDYELQIGERHQETGIAGITEPTEWVSATFRIVHGDIVEPSITISKNNLTLNPNVQASFGISGDYADSVSVYHNHVLLRTFSIANPTFSETIQFTPTEPGNNWITAVAMNRFGFRVLDVVDFTVTASTNIVETHNRAPLLQVFPNPATNYVVVSADTHGSVPLPIGTEITIYNMLGRLVGTFRTTGEETRIDVSNFPAGLYMLRVGDVVLRWIKE